MVAEDADVIVAIGTRLHDLTTGSWALFKNPHARFVSINTARWDAMKQHATAVIGDALLGIEQLDAAVGDYSAPADWLSFSQAQMRHLGSLLVQQGIITGTSGRYGQVLKLRPPLVFSRDDADKALAAIDSALRQI